MSTVNKIIRQELKPDSIVSMGDECLYDDNGTICVYRISKILSKDGFVNSCKNEDVIRLVDIDIVASPVLYSINNEEEAFGDSQKCMEELVSKLNESFKTPTEEFIAQMFDYESTVVYENGKWAYDPTCVCHFSMDSYVDTWFEKYKKYHPEALQADGTWRVSR